MDGKSFWIGLGVGAAAMLVVCLVLLFATAAIMLKHKRGIAAKSYQATALCPLAGDVAVTDILKPINQKFNVPAMALAVVTSDGLKFVGAVGVRKRGTDIPVTLDDLWHLGSDGKAMTSTLIARLVERGQLSWDTTLAEVFPEIAPQMNPGFRKVTLLQLLSHHAGLPANLDLGKYSGDDVRQLRLRAVRDELAKKPESEPGTQIFVFQSWLHHRGGGRGENHRQVLGTGHHCGIVPAIADEFRRLWRHWERRGKLTSPGHTPKTASRWIKTARTWTIRR